MKLNDVIPEFTAEQFYGTKEPYEFLYRFKSDKFKLGQMRERLKEQAASKGVRGFMGLWSAYLESKERKPAGGNTTQFEGQDEELFCGRYICDESGVSYRNRQGEYKTVCRHPIMPTERLINVENGEERLRLAYKKGGVWRSAVAEKSVIASTTSILKLAAHGVMVNSENAKELSTYLLEMEHLNYELIPESLSVGRLGWVKGHGFSPYVHNLTFDGEDRFRSIYDAVKPCGSRDIWIEQMKKLRAEKTAGRLFLAASFASATVEPCGLLPFFVHAWGGTETGKTVGLMIAASVWADPDPGRFIQTFNATSVGQELTASFLHSLPMCVDELQIQSAAGVRDFDRTVYQLTEGVGRTRGAKSGGLQKTNTWKNCIITNGEHPISTANSGGGAVNRIIEFECADKIYSDLVGICAAVRENYGFAGREFTDHIGTDGAREKIRRLRSGFFDVLLKSDSTDKQAASASALLAADAVATELFFRDGNALTPDEIVLFMTKKSEVDVNLRAYNYACELCERNPNRFEKNDFGSWAGEVWGKREGDYVYIIKSVFDREMSDAGFNPTAFLAWAKRRGLLLTDENKRVKNARITGTTTRCVCLRTGEVF